MNSVETGREIPQDFTAGAASTARIISGARTTTSTLSPACAATQIEQAWCGDVESSGCECTACTTPVAHTKAIASKQTALVAKLRDGDALNNLRL
jgi:hypothetical protein